jgi:hypothetical protein
VTDHYSEAKRLFPEVRSLVSQIQGVCREISSLESSPPPSGGQDAAAAQSRMQEHQRRLEGLRNRHSGLCDKLNKLLHTLSKLAGKLDEVSGRYQQDASLYGQAGSQIEVREAQYKVNEAQSYARQFANERKKQADEIRDLISWAQKVMSSSQTGGGGAAGHQTSSLDDVVSDAFKGTGKKCSYRVEPSGYMKPVSYISSTAIRDFAGYRHGSYTTSRNRYRPGDHRSYTGGMEWK